RTLALRTVPVAARVVRDLAVRALLATRDMSTECRGAAVLNRRHHLQLTKADMVGVGSAPCWSMIAEDIRDLQCRTRHAGRALGGWLDPLDLTGDMLQRAHDLLDRLGGDASIESGGVELGVPEQHLDHPDIDVLLKQVGGEAVPQGVERYALVDLGPIGCGMAGAIELRS